MISDIDETIRQILIKEGGLDTGEIDISFDMPTREWSGSISKPTLNCYLFDIRENIERRQFGMRMERSGPNGASRMRPTTFFDLTYVVTAWTRVVEDEHRLLWHALTTLLRFGSLPSQHLQGVLAEVPGEVAVQTAHPNSILKNPNDFWGSLDNQLRPALAFVVTLPYDRAGFPVGPPVMTTTMRFRQRGAATPPEDFIWVGGTLRDEREQLMHGASVTLQGHAERATTDDEGRWRLRVPAPGAWTLVVEAEGKTTIRTIDVPEPEYALTFVDAGTNQPTKLRKSRKGGEAR